MSEKSDAKIDSAELAEHDTCEIVERGIEEVIDSNMPSDKKVDVIISMMRSTQITSPIPPASEMKEYELIRPGTFDQFMGFLSSQEVHRIESEKRTFNVSVIFELIGRIVAYVLAGVLIYVGYLLAMAGQVAVACTIFGTTIAGVIISTVWGRSDNEKKA